MAHLLADKFMLSPNLKLCFAKRIFSVMQPQIWSQHKLVHKQTGHPVQCFARSAWGITTNYHSLKDLLVVKFT